MILITGATGYLGRAVVEKLRDKEDILIISRKQRKQETIKGNISDFKTVKKAVKKSDSVIHLAGNVSLLGKWKPMYQTNVKGTENVMKAAMEHNLEKVVHMGSCASDTKYQTNYVITKKLSEQVAMAHWPYLKVPIIKASIIYDEEKLRILKKIPWFPFIHKKQKIHMSYRDTVAESIVKAHKKPKNKQYYVNDKNPILLTEAYKAIMQGKNTPYAPIVPGTLLDWFIMATWPIEQITKPFDFKPYTLLNYFFENREFDNSETIRDLKIKQVNTFKKLKEIFTSQE